MIKDMYKNLIDYIKNNALIIIIILLFILGSLIISKSEYKIFGALIATFGILLIPIIGLIKWLINKNKN